MKALLVIVGLVLVSGSAFSRDAVFSVPSTLVGKTGSPGHCDLIYGAPGNYIEDRNQTHPPFEDLVKTMKISAEAGSLIRDAFGYSDTVPLSVVQSKLSDFQSDCETNTSYRNSFVCSTESLSGGFSGSCENIGRLVQIMNEQIYNFKR